MEDENKDFLKKLSLLDAELTLLDHYRSIRLALSLGFILGNLSGIGIMLLINFLTMK